jgi:hypothetical protein
MNPDKIISRNDISPEDRKSNDRIYWRTIRFALIQQAILLVISSLILDGGDIFRLSITAVILTWVPSLVILCRGIYPKYYVLSKADSAIIKHGFWVFFLLMITLYHYNLLPNNYYFSYRKKKLNRPPVTELFLNTKTYHMRPV